MMKLPLVLAVVFFCAITSGSHLGLRLGEKPLQVTFIYESYCIYCIQYLEEQIMEVYNVFKQHFHLNLLPYAQQKFVDGHWVFNCQHGPDECVGNKLHACAIYQACGDSGTVSCAVSKVSQVMGYISCVMKEKSQLEATAKCAKAYELDADNIISCMKGDKGDELLNFYGNQTEKFASWLAYVPAVVVNGKHDEAAENNLMKRLCQLKPDVCKPAQE